MNKNPISKIIALTSLVILSIFVIGAAAVLSYNFATNNSEHARRGQMAGSNGEGEGGGTTSGTSQPLTDVNFLLTGIDEHNLADVIFVAHFNAERGSVHVISIPRDMRVQFSESQRQELIDRGISSPATHHFRINELVNRSGGRNDRGFEYARNYVGDMLGIEIHHHVSMYLTGFRSIVDAIGGVYMYIPQRLFYDGRTCIYTGQFFPNRIFIDLQQGYHLLDGRQAEALVRFRNHPRGDFFRIELQQAFMQAFFEQALTLEALGNNPLGLIGSLMFHVSTDIGMPIANDFVQRGIIDALDVNNVSFHMLPSIQSGANLYIDNANALKLVNGILTGVLFEEYEEQEE